MYLARLVINNHPSCRRAVDDLADPYEMHRTLMKAFPDADDGGPGRVLWRLEPLRRGRPATVLVQSEDPPDFAPLRDAPGYLLDKPKITELGDRFRASLTEGRLLRFRLRANPTVTREGKRHGLVRDDERRNWLVNKGKSGGFEPVDFLPARSERVVSRRKSGARPQTFVAVDYEGVLRITDPEAFWRSLTGGIGPAKGYGFGLLSVARA